MINFVIYDSNGIITKSGRAIDIEMADLQKDVAENIIYEVGSADTHYVLNNVLTQRPVQNTTLSSTIIIANGIDTLIISNAPIGAVCQIKNLSTGELITGTIDGTDSFVTDHDSVFELFIDLWPYLPYRNLINAI